ncbi:MAG: hypothetical protein FWC41_04700 [Firmicutes bacterium]|nr:hypothetical protein [Bacillota bacterium]
MLILRTTKPLIKLCSFSLSFTFLFSGVLAKGVDGRFEQSEDGKVSYISEQHESKNYQSICEENKKLEHFVQRIRDIINKSCNQSISYYSNDTLVNELSVNIAQNIVDTKHPEDLLGDIEYIFNNADYRVVAEYLKSLKEDNGEKILKLIHSKSGPLLDYNISKQKQLESTTNISGFVKKLIKKHTLSDLFAETDSKGIYFYAKNKHGEEIIKELYHDATGNILDYIRPLSKLRN